MRFCRHTTALSLLGVLTLGGVISPLTHLIYMAVSDVYAPAPSHSEHGHLSTDHATAALPSDHPYWQAPHEGHLSCPYVDLFATPLLGDTAQPVAARGGDHRAASLQECSQVSRCAALLFSYTVRGPPTAASLL